MLLNTQMPYTRLSAWESIAVLCIILKMNCLLPEICVRIALELQIC